MLSNGPRRGLDRGSSPEAAGKSLPKVNPIGRWTRVQGRYLVDEYGGCLMNGGEVDQLRFLRFSAR